MIILYVALLKIFKHENGLHLFNYIQKSYIIFKTLRFMSSRSEKSHVPKYISKQILN